MYPDNPECCPNSDLAIDNHSPELKAICPSLSRQRACTLDRQTLLAVSSRRLFNIIFGQACSVILFRRDRALYFLVNNADFMICFNSYFSAFVINFKIPQ